MMPSCWIYSSSLILAHLQQRALWAPPSAQDQTNVRLVIIREGPSSPCSCSSSCSGVSSSSFSLLMFLLLSSTFSLFSPSSCPPIAWRTKSNVRCGKYTPRINEVIDCEGRKPTLQWLETHATTSCKNKCVTSQLGVGVCKSRAIQNKYDTLCVKYSKPITYNRFAMTYSAKRAFRTDYALTHVGQRNCAITHAMSMKFSFLMIGLLLSSLLVVLCDHCWSLLLFCNDSWLMLRWNNDYGPYAIKINSFEIVNPLHKIHVFFKAHFFFELYT